MFYIIATTYTGPNSDQDAYTDIDTVEISTKPAKKNMSHEVCTEGWCGTSNDFSLHAHGEYETIEAASKAVIDIFGDVREVENGEFSENVLSTFKLGRYKSMSKDAVADWCQEDISSIKATTSDADIKRMVSEAEEYANADGKTLSIDLHELLEEARDELKEDDQ